VDHRDEPGDDERIEWASQEHSLSFSRRDPPEFCENLPSIEEGAGKAGCVGRTRSLAWDEKEPHERSHHRFSLSSGFPRAIGFNGFLRALPGEPGFLATIPVQCEALSRVDTSVGVSEPHDFTVRVGALRLCAPQASIAARTQRL
jgi:hypothetical protein